MRIYKRTSILIPVVLALSLLCSLPSYARKWTIPERLDNLSLAIDKSKDVNELTNKQVDELKVLLSEVKTKAEEMKSKNGGKLNDDDTRRVNKEINAVSVKLLKYRLDNVYNCG